MLNIVCGILNLFVALWNVFIVFKILGFKKQKCSECSEEAYKVCKRHLAALSVIAYEVLNERKKENKNV